jgi:hypothetical protein
MRSRARLLREEKMSREMLKLEGEEHVPVLYINASRVLSVEESSVSRVEEDPFHSVRLRMNIPGLSYYFEGKAARAVMTQLRAAGVLPGKPITELPMPTSGERLGP